MYLCMCVGRREEGGEHEREQEGGKRVKGWGGMRLWPLLQGLMWKLSTDLCDFTLVLQRGPALPLTVLQW